MSYYLEARKHERNIRKAANRHKVCTHGNEPPFRPTTGREDQLLKWRAPVSR